MDQPIPFWLVAQFTLQPDTFFAVQYPKIGVQSIVEIDGGVAEYLVTFSPELVGELQRYKTGVIVSQWANSTYGSEASIQVVAALNNTSIETATNEMRVAFLRPDGSLANVADCGTTSVTISVMRTA